MEITETQRIKFNILFTSQTFLKKRKNHNKFKHQSHAVYLMTLENSFNTRNIHFRIE